MKEFLILDIETNAMSWDSFDEAQQEYLLRGATTEEMQEKKIRELSLAPLTAQVVCIGLMHCKEQPDKTYAVHQSAALMTDPNGSETERTVTDLPDATKMVSYSERGVLHSFWQYLNDNSSVHLITFNGRNFDLPFLMLRSAVLGIRPSRNLMSGTKFNYAHHTDLLDEFTFFMPQLTGATRRYNFDFITKAFGIASPKAEGVDGSKVGELYTAGEYAVIAEYCMRDVHATWELYLKWAELLKF